MEEWCLKDCAMHLFFDTCNCIGALPGGIIVGQTYFQNHHCWFDNKKYFIIPEHYLLGFLKILEDLAEKIMESEAEETERVKIEMKDGIITSAVRTIV